MLSHQEAAIQRMKFGFCKIAIREPHILKLFIKECLHPFFVFSLYSTLLWVYEDYAVFAYLILFLNVASAIMNLLAIRENLQNLNEMASNHGKCLVFRTEYQKEVDNSEIVPGDVISLSSNCKVPADCILIEGSVLINESSLTGESLPIQKQRPPNEEELIKSGKKYIIMEGTIV